MPRAAASASFAVARASSSSARARSSAAVRRRISRAARRARSASTPSSASRSSASRSASSAAARVSAAARLASVTSRCASRASSRRWPASARRRAARRTPSASPRRARSVLRPASMAARSSARWAPPLLARPALGLLGCFRGLGGGLERGLGAGHVSAHGLALSFGGLELIVAAGERLRVRVEGGERGRGLLVRCEGCVVRRARRGAGFGRLLRLGGVPPCRFRCLPARACGTELLLHGFRRLPRSLGLFQGDLRRFSRVDQRRARRGLAALRLARGGEGLLHLLLSRVQDGLEDRVLGEGVEGVGQLGAALLGAIATQAPGEDRVRLGLLAEQRLGEEALGHAPRAALSPRARDAPAELIAQALVDLASAGLDGERVAVGRALEQGRPSGVAREGLRDPPEPALLDLERELHVRPRVAVPRHPRLGMARGHGQEQRRANRRAERRLAEVVRPVDDVQAAAEVELRLPDAPEVTHHEASDPHGRSPLASRAPVRRESSKSR